MSVIEIRISHLLIPIRTVYFVVQYTMLPKSGNINIMTSVDRMVMFNLMTRRRINLVRLILDFILAVVNVERRRHATLPYGMFLTKVFIKAQLPPDGHRANYERPTTTIKTFFALGLKLQSQDKEKKKKDKKKKDSATAVAKVPSTKKGKSKPSKEDKKKKKRRERSLLPIPEEKGKSKRRVMTFAEESSSSSRSENGVSAIAIEPINLADIATTITAPPTFHAARPAQRRIVIREFAPQEKLAQKEFLEGKGKKKVKKAPGTPSRDSTPFPLRRIKREVEENKLREEVYNTLITSYYA